MQALLDSHRENHLMGLFKNIKQGLETVMSPPSPEEIEESLKHLTPEQRAAYDANMAQVAEGEAESQASWEHAQALNDQARILEGPAGDALHGSAMRDTMSPDEINAKLAAGQGGNVMKEMLAASKADFKSAFKSARPAGGTKQESDPARRQAIMAEERAGRDAARAPYLAPAAPPVTVTRLTTRGKTQVDEVLAFLAQSGLSARPDQVYGLYRVPDRISQNLTPHSEKGRVVEWDVVHEPTAGGGAGGPTTVAEFPARDHWVARRRDEPSILDEDLALAYLVRAGIGPEQTLGMARYCELIEPSWGDEDGGIVTNVEGVLAFHPPGLGEDLVDQMAQEAPLALPAGPPGGVHVEVLNWDAIAKVVHPELQKAALTPSPFPYLPSTPQELLRSYLEVVGVAARDCYGAAVTVHRRREREGAHGNMGPAHPCADGKDRRRYHCSEQVVVTYRDQPAYAEGRDRWTDYQRTVLQAHLHKGTDVRSPVWVDDDSDIESAIIRGGLKVMRIADRVAAIGEGKAPPPFRYCWPPVGE